jgi:tetratricopeptide (TPR) repeat protein
MDLEAFLRADLPTEKAALVLAHLVRGCERCQAAIAAGSPSLFDQVELAEPEELEISPELDAAYEAAFDRAFASALRKAGQSLSEREEATAVLLRQGPAALVDQTSRFGSRIVCEALFERCQSLRHEDPMQMVEMALLATGVARNVDAAELGADHTADQAVDLEARSWGELGNAYRVAEDLHRAENALSRAFELFEVGSGDPLLAARLFDLQASLLVSQRRFDSALTLLDSVQAIHRQHGDLQGAGRALISKGLYTGYSGEPREAIRLLQEGLSLVDAGRDPNLALSAVHNMILFLVDCGRFEEAQSLLAENRWRYERDGGARLNQVKHLWLGGLIRAGLGDVDGAEQALLEARQGFEEAGLSYHAAVTSLDLGTVWIRQGRASEARQVVEKAVEVFQALGIGREAMGALLLLRKAFEMERVTAALLQSVADYLRRLEHNPGARFDLRAA